MALLATLEGLGIPTRKDGGIFVACLGACDAVGATVAGCLGAAFEDTKMVRDLPVGKGVNKMADGNEKILATWAPVDVRSYNGPGKLADVWDIPGRQLIGWGIDPLTYTMRGKWWFFPIPMFLELYSEVYALYKDLNTEERAAIAYYNYLGKYFEPVNAVDANIYKYKLNVLKDFLNNMGLRNAWVKVEGEQSRTGQAAAASQQASAAAKAYAAAMERQKQEAAKIEEAKQTATYEINEEINKTGGDGQTTTAADSGILPVAIAAAAALAFMG